MRASGQARHMMNSKSNALIDKPLFIVISVISLVQPGSLIYIGLSTLDSVLTIWSFLVLIYTASFFIQKNKMPAVVCWVICYHIILALFTFLDDNPNYGEIIKTAGPAIALCLLTWICITRDAKRYFISASFALGFLLFVNLISMVLFPSGLYITTGVEQDINYFLGFDNSFVLWTVPFVFHVATLSIIMQGRLMWWTIPCFVLAFATEAMTWAVTGMITIILEVALVIAVCTFKKTLSFQSIILISVVAFVLLVILKVQYHFSNIFELYLNKDVSFTGRVELWNSAIESFLNSPVIGSGISNDFLYGIITQPHCLYLEVLYRGGIPLLIVLVLMFIELIKAGKRSNGNQLVAVSIACVGAWLICMTTDSILHKSFFWAMMTACVAVSVLPDSASGSNCQRRRSNAYSS